MECNTRMSLARICNARCPPSSLFSNIPRLLNRSHSHLSPTINPSSSSSSSSSSLVSPRLIQNRKFHLSKCCNFSDSASAVPLKSKIQKPTINFCQKCGGPTKYSVPEGEEKERAVCTTCGHVYYENPKMVVGCLIQHDNKVLLCKRKIPPSYGLWTLPAGYLELDESAAAGAIRETFEEACAEAEILSPFAQLDIPVIGQSYIIFRAQLKNPDFSPGPETLECALFQLEEIPFQSLAFSSVSVTLKLFIEDANAGKFNFHYCIIEKRPGASPSDLQGFVVSQHIKS